MEGLDGGPEKAGADDAPMLVAARKPLLQAVRDGDFMAPVERPPSTEKDVSEWIFRGLVAARERDLALLALIRRRRETRLTLRLKALHYKARALIGRRVERRTIRALLDDLDALGKAIRQEP